MNSKDATIEIAKNLEDIFPGCHVEFPYDSDDSGVVYVRVYGVPDTEVNASKTHVWEVIDKLGVVEGVEFVPSIISMTNTRQYHSGYLPVTDDFDHAVSDRVMRLLEQPAERYDVLPARSHPCIVYGWGDSDEHAVLHNIGEVTDDRSFKFAA